MPLTASRRTAWTRFSCSADHGTQGGRAKLCEEVCPVCIIHTMFLQPCNPHAFHMDDCFHAGHTRAKLTSMFDGERCRGNVPSTMAVDVGSVPLNLSYGMC